MNPWFHMKTGMAWLLGAALALAGTLLVLQLAALLAWQYSVALGTRSWPQLPVTLVFADHAKVSATTAQFLPVIPEVPWSWLRNPQNADTLPHTAATSVLGALHVGLIPALLGLFLTYLGIKLIRRQKQRYAVAQREKDDRLRRVRAYRRETRTEPNFTELRTEEPTLTEPRREPRLSA